MTQPGQATELEDADQAVFSLVHIVGACHYRAFRRLPRTAAGSAQQEGNPAMTAVYVMIALVVGVFAGAGIALIAKRGQSGTTGKILEHVERIGAVFTNAAHRGRVGEIVLENLLEATGLGKHRDFDLQATLPEGGRPDVVLKFPGRGKPGRRLQIPSRSLPALYICYHRS